MFYKEKKILFEIFGQGPVFFLLLNDYGTIYHSQLEWRILLFYYVYILSCFLHGTRRLTMNSQAISHLRTDQIGFVFSRVAALDAFSLDHNVL